MSEQKSNFMAALDQWSEASVIAPLFQAFRTHYVEYDDEALAVAAADAKKAIREKVLESYRNGQTSKPAPAAPVPARKPWGRR